jgi:hypothetical protein
MLYLYIEISSINPQGLEGRVRKSVVERHPELVDDVELGLKFLARK